MNEALQSKLVEIISAISNGVAAAGTFVMEQLPDVAIQYVAYGRAYYTFLIILSALILFVLLPLAVRWAWKDGSETRCMLVGFSSVPLVFIFALTFAFNIGSFFKVWFAPKIWLITELVRIIK